MPLIEGLFDRNGRKKTIFLKINHKLEFNEIDQGLISTRANNGTSLIDEDQSVDNMLMNNSLNSDCSQLEISITQSESLQQRMNVL